MRIKIQSDYNYQKLCPVWIHPTMAPVYFNTLQWQMQIVKIIGKTLILATVSGHEAGHPH